jgi:hypothetical protein
MEGAFHRLLWRRLDTPGHDACRLQQSDTGWQLDGAAVFRDEEEGGPALLTYRLVSGPDWRTLEGQVRGWLGPQQVDFQVARGDGGVWTLNGSAVPGLESCVDLDLGFTPASNLFQLRRLDLAKGQAADAPVAWLDVSAGTLDLLHQRYDRRDDSAYWYEAPRFDYTAMLDVDPSGFIRLYPGLWEAEPWFART